MKRPKDPPIDPTKPIKSKIKTSSKILLLLEVDLKISWYGLSTFKKNFWPKFNILKGNCCTHFVSIQSTNCQRVPKSNFKSQVLIFYRFFYIYLKYQFKSPFFVLTFFDNFNFLNTLFSKLMINFWWLKSIIISFEYIDFGRPSLL